MRRSRRLQLGTEVFLRRRLDVRGLLRRAGAPCRSARRVHRRRQRPAEPRRRRRAARVRQLLPARGHELLPCGVSAQRPSIVCPYHSRTYALDGSLKTAKGFKGTAGFDDSLWSLVELPVTKWHGLTFVDVSGGAGSLAGAPGQPHQLVSPQPPPPLVVPGRPTQKTPPQLKDHTPKQ